MRILLQCALGAAVLLTAMAAQAAVVKLEPLDPALGDPVELEPGESMLLLVTVSELPAPGLAAFQVEIDFDPDVVMVADPNAALVDPFTPLGASPSICELVRGSETCEDPPWLLTSTERAPQGIGEIDEVAGTLVVAYGTSGAQSLPIGDGALAIIDVSAIDEGTTELVFSLIILADNSEPPSVYPSSSSSLIFEVPEPGPSTSALAAWTTLAILARTRVIRRT